MSLKKSASVKILNQLADPIAAKDYNNGQWYGLPNSSQVNTGFSVCSAANTAATLTLAAPGAGTSWLLTGLQFCAAGGTVGTLAYATGTLTGSSSTAPSDGDTIVIGGKTYTFKTTLAVSATEGQVLIGTTGSTDAAYTNLGKAINQTGAQGTNYWVAQKDANVSAGSVTSHNIVVTALLPGSQGNTITTTAAGSAPGSWGAGTLASGAGCNFQILDGTKVVKNFFLTAAGQQPITFYPPLKFTANGAVSVTVGPGGSGVVTAISVDALKQN